MTSPSCPTVPTRAIRALLEQAAREQRILVTLDSDFGYLVFVGGMPHFLPQGRWAGR